MTTPAHEKAVFQLVYRRSGRPVSTLSSQDRLLQDLGIDGDDAAELLLELSRAFQIDMSTLEMAKHFRSEPNLFSVLRLPGSRKKELAEKVPVSVADLIRAAETRKWPL
jgi:acyl carrier protein